MCQGRLKDQALWSWLGFVQVQPSERKASESVMDPIDHVIMWLISHGWILKYQRRWSSLNAQVINNIWLLQINDAILYAIFFILSGDGGGATPNMGTSVYQLRSCFKIPFWEQPSSTIDYVSHCGFIASAMLQRRAQIIGLSIYFNCFYIILIWSRWILHVGSFIVGRSYSPGRGS